MIVALELLLFWAYIGSIKFILIGFQRVLKTTVS